MLTSQSYILPEKTDAGSLEVRSPCIAQAKKLSFSRATQLKRVAYIKENIQSNSSASMAQMSVHGSGLE